MTPWAASTTLSTWETYRSACACSRRQTSVRQHTVARVYCIFTHILLPVSLAYLTAATHGLQEEAAALAAKLERVHQLQYGSKGEGEAPSVPFHLPEPRKDAALLFPPTPLLKLFENNWPLLTVTKGYFDGAVLEDDKKFAADSAVPEGEAGGEWDNLELPEEGKERREGEEGTHGCTLNVCTRC